MNITVITPFDSSNFGAYLQAYCLKKQLENMGHTVSHALTRSSEYVIGLYYKDKPVRKKHKLFRWKFEKAKKYGQRKLKLFRKDQKVFNITNDLSKADAYVLGSDEIWNIRKNAFRNEIFWGINLTPAISYASSIGNAQLSMFKENPKYINAVDKLSSVLVRDIRTKEFVESNTNKKAEIVCDPTMLIPVENYGEELNDTYISNNKCFLVYAYYVSKSEKKAIKAYAKENGLKVVSCCFYHDWCDYQCECRPLQFSSLIRQCESVFTITFHGSIFSILNHANFVSVPISEKTNQLLQQFGLEKRLLPESDFSKERLCEILNGEKPDYKEIEEKIKVIRNSSIEKLNTALSNVCGG